MNFIMIGLLLREALDRLRVRLNMYLVSLMLPYVAVGDSAVRPSRLLAAKDDRERFVTATETDRRVTPVTSERYRLDDFEQDDDDVDDADNDKVVPVYSFICLFALY